MFGLNWSVESRTRNRLRTVLQVVPMEERVVPAWVGASIINYSTPGVTNVGAQGSVGAIQSASVNPGNPDQVYVGAVNGGVWRTDNFSAATPTWTPVGDFLPSLAIGSVSASPLNFNHIFVASAGTTFGVDPVSDPARISAGGGIGGVPQGVFRSLDGGLTWDQYGKTQFGNRKIREIVASGSTTTGNLFGQLVLAATNSGLFRSTDGGVTWAILPASPGGATKNVTDLKLDETDSSGQSFYAAVVGNGAGNGIYITRNGGTSWTAVNGAGDPTVTTDDVTTTFGDATHQQINPSMLAAAQNIRLAVYYANRGSPVTRVYAAIIDGNPSSSSFGKIAVPDSNTNDYTHTGFIVGVPRPITAGVGVQWSDLGDPNVQAGFQGSIHTALVSPFDVNNPVNAQGTVYFAGDRASNNQGTNVINVDGTNTDNSLTANGTQQHADSRALYSDFRGGLINVGDGGIYQLLNAGTANERWVSKIGNLQVTEYYSVGWDSNSNVIAGGAQDNGSPYSSPIDTTNGGTPPIRTIDATGGDGGVVGIDVTTIPGSSIRYVGSQNLGGFQRQVYDASGTRISSTPIAQFLLTEAQFITPFKLNATNPQQILVGGVSRLYESTNQGFGFNTISFAAFGTPEAITYGGFRNGFANADAAWVSTQANGALPAGNPGLYFRNSSAFSLGSFTRVTAYNNATMGVIVNLVVDPQDYTTVYAVTRDGRAYMIKIDSTLPNGEITASQVAAATVTAITGNLQTIIGQSTAVASNNATVGVAPSVTASIEQYDPSPAAGDSIVLIGGLGGVYAAKTVSGATTSWVKVSTGTPNASVQSLVYNIADDVLVAGTYGRGAFILTDASSFLDKAKTNIVLTESAPAILTGQSVTFTATISTNVSPLPGPLTGNIVFSNGATILATVPIVNGVASFTTTSLPPGTYNVQASFAANTIYKGSVSNIVTLIVSNLAPSTTTVTSNLNPSIVTQAVTLTATVTGFPGRGVPTGTVTFLANGVPITGGTVTLDANGVASFVTTRLPIGSTTITAAYSGAVDYLTSSATLVQTVTGIPGAGGPGTNSPVGLFASGSGLGSLPQVVVYNPDNSVRFTFQPYASGYQGGVRVAVGDVDGDGTDDIVTATGEGGGPHVTVWSGVTLTQIGSFYAYDEFFFGGLFLAVGDVNGDGRKDIITGVGPGGGPHVKVFDFANLFSANGGLLYSNYVYDKAVSTGISVATGDVNGDGRVDIIVGAGPGGGPHVKAIDYLTGTELASYYAYDERFAGGVVVAAGDLDGNGTADIITGTAAIGTPHVTGWDVSTGLPNRLVSFFAYDQTFTYGVRVAAKDRTGTGISDIITGNGPQSPSRARVFDNVGGLKADLDPFASDVFGIFVG